MKRRLLVLASAATIISIPTSRAGPAVSPPKYALLSLIGEKFNVVTYQPAIGSGLERNIQESVSLPSAPFDVTALTAMQDAIKRVPGHQDALLYINTAPELFSNPTTLFDDSKVVLPPAMIGAMRKDGASHLLLLTRHRQEALLRARNVAIGSGHLEGIGYYIDRQQMMRRSDTQESGRGFLAPFVYLQLSLVNLADERVLRQHTISASTTLSAARNKDGVDPWDVLTAKEKLDLLDRMIVSELKHAMNKMIEYDGP